MSKRCYFQFFSFHFFICHLLYASLYSSLMETLILIKIILNYQF